MGLMLTILTATLYALLGYYFWQTRWHAVRAEPKGATWEKSVVAIPLALHALTLYPILFAANGVNLGVGSALSTIAWLTVALYWLTSFAYPVESLKALILPLAALFTLAPVAFPETHFLSYTRTPAFPLHLLISMLAYSLFTIAALHAVLMSIIEKRLHSGVAPRQAAGFPPLLTMETLLFRIIGAGFALLTLAVVSGMFFSDTLFGKPLQLNHKTVFALLSWVVFGALLAGRMIYGWRGRMAVRWTWAGFVMLLLAYVGSKFVLEVLLHR